MTCSTECWEQSTRMVIRLRLGSWVGPTASESMLKPRRANSPAQRVSTPGPFSTSTERVWCVMAAPCARGAPGLPGAPDRSVAPSSGTLGWWRHGGAKARRSPSVPPSGRTRSSGAGRPCCGTPSDVGVEPTSDALLHPRVVILRPLHVDHLGGRGAGRHHRIHLLLVVDVRIDHA